MNTLKLFEGVCVGVAVAVGVLPAQSANNKHTHTQSPRREQHANIKTTAGPARITCRQTGRQCLLACVGMHASEPCTKSRVIKRILYGYTRCALGAGWPPYIFVWTRAKCGWVQQQNRSSKNLLARTNHALTVKCFERACGRACVSICTFRQSSVRPNAQYN